MSRKPKKGYYVRGHFVAEGSELDLELKAELKGTTESSKTDLKRESEELQKLGEELMHLRAELLAPLGLPDKLLDAMAEALWSGTETALAPLFANWGQEPEEVDSVEAEVLSRL